MPDCESGTLTWYIKHLWICPHVPRCFHREQCAHYKSATVAHADHQIQRYVRLRQSGLSVRETLDQL